MNFRLLLFLLLSAFTSFSQEGSLRVYEIKVDTPVQKLPDDYWQMFVDKTNKLTFNEIRTSVQFHKNNTLQSGFGFKGVKSYWVRFKLKNLTGKDQNLVFRNFPQSDRYQVFIVRPSGKTETYTSGTYVPFSKRDGLKERYAVPITIASGEELLLYKNLYINKVQAQDELYIGYSEYKTFVEKNYVNAPWFIGDIRNWLIAGILIFGFFFNFFFYWIDRDKVYLFMAMLLLIEGLWYLSINGNNFFRESPGIRYYYSYLVTHIVFFTMVTQFVRHFLKTFKYYPKWDKIILVLLGLMIISSLASRYFLMDFVSKSMQDIPQLVEQIIFIVLMTSLLISFLFFKKEKDRLTNLSVVAAFPLFLLWSVIYAIQQFSYLNFTKKGTTPPGILTWLDEQLLLIEMFCVAWFAIFFTWILLQRYALLRKQYAQQALEREREKVEIMNRQKEILEKQVEERTFELKKSIQELKTTQQQLIQSEKMASLGELTAGIAHEIQNPLNFINNFSDINTELIDEMEQEISSGKLAEAKSIANDIKENNNKITFHGQRADSIVKNMLQHSRKNSGEKELTDINVLAEEYLRLSYHGLRAKDKSFNAIMKTDFDPTVGKISIVSQDISRVLLNLFNNAFYSVSEKKNVLPNSHPGNSYEPTVSVSTKRDGDKIIIAVEDNGTGIPQSVVDKIYQPFFTTKPTGEGTGLGLSMSYEIIKNGHNGDLQVSSKEGEYAAFKIILPTEPLEK